MDTRAIPSLTTAQLARNPKLLQVQSIIRHGARTPYENYFCWDNYDLIWDCDVTFLGIPSNTNTGTERPTSLLFRKLYDSYPNELGGTCYTGQLIDEGYSQELQNGYHIKDAYIGDSADKLFQSSKISELDFDDFYIRGDDEQRTLMSGQLLMEAFLEADVETIIPYHSGDYSLDTIYPNSAVCHLLSTVQGIAQASPEYQEINSSAATTNLVSQMNSVLGHFYWSSILDCLFTTHCTENPIPDGVTNKMFNDSISYVEWDTAYVYLYNNSRYAKLAMFDLVVDVMNEIQPWTEGSTGKKFVLYSGHDTTVMPFLATFGDKVWDQLWAPYASMINIELYQIDSDFYFRMIYNGKELLIPGCDDYLCDVEVLKEATSWTSEHYDCSARFSSNVQSLTSRKSTTQPTLVEKDNGSQITSLIVVVLSSVSIGILIGGFAVNFYMKSKSKKSLSDYSKLEQSNESL